MKHTPPSSGFAGALIIFGALIVLGMIVHALHRNPNQPEWECHPYPGTCDIDWDWHPGTNHP